MQTFEYQARRLDGSRVQGLLVAESERALDHELEEQGLFLTRARAANTKQLPGNGRLKGFELVTLMNQLSTLLGAGVPILEALRGLGQRLPSANARALVDTVADRIQAGQSVSETFEQFPKAFDPVLRASVRAGEFSGSLPAVLSNQAAFLQWRGQIRATTTQALVYPAMLCVAITGLIVVMMTFVLPRIVSMLPGGEEALPGPTRFLMQISNALTSNWPLIVGALALAGTGAFLALRREAIAIRFQRALLHVPRLGELLSMIAVSRFARTASTLQDAGCDMMRVLEVSGDACGNAYYRSVFAQARERVSGGENLSDALEASGDVDPMLLQLVRVGEATGSLDQCLARLSDSYDEEVPRLVKWFLALLEPAILMVAGVVVAFIMLAAILPMLSLYQTM